MIKRGRKRDPLQDLLQPWHRLRGAPDEARAALCEDRRELALEQARVEADADPAGPDRSQVGDRPVDRVRREDEHALPLLEPELAPAARCAADRLTELAVGDACVPGLDRDLVVRARGEQVLGGVHPRAADPCTDGLAPSSRSAARLQTARYRACSPRQSSSCSHWRNSPSTSARRRHRRLVRVVDRERPLRGARADHVRVEGVDDPVERRAQLRVLAHAGGVPDEVEVGDVEAAVGLRLDEDRIHHRDDLLLGRPRRRHRASDPVGCLRERPAHRRQDQVLLRLEVVRDQALAHAGRLGDLPQRGPVDAALSDQPVGAADELRLPRRMLLLEGGPALLRRCDREGLHAGAPSLRPRRARAAPGRRRPSPCAFDTRARGRCCPWAWPRPRPPRPLRRSHPRRARARRAAFGFGTRTGREETAPSASRASVQAPLSSRRTAAATPSSGKSMLPRRRSFM